ncbi:MAG: glutathione S-transferase family protein [Alphaproteobacteria bacterium]|nr:glutathione S-transferase family protein [Alphaproteobacteria bacterium]
MLKLWGRPTSARTLKVLWALAEIGIEFDFILASATMGPDGSVDKGNQPYGVVDTAEYRAINPNGTVPTIDDAGFTLWESNSIVRYLAMKYAPDMMYDDDIETFALASRWMDWENNELLHGQHALVMQLIRLPENQRDPSEVEAARQDLIPKFQMIDDQLGRTRFIAGERFTMGDIPIGLRTHRWHLFDIERPPMANLARWYDEIRTHRGFKAWIEDPANHLSG